MTNVEQFVYKHVTLRIVQYPRFHRALRVLYNTFYRNTSLYPTTRLRKLVKKTDALIAKHNMPIVCITGNGAYTLENGLKFSFERGTNKKQRPEQMYEAETFAELQSAIRKGGTQPYTFIDVGANVGWFSLSVAQQCKTIGRDAKIYSLEPVPSTCSDLQENIRLNAFSNIHAYGYAASDKEGTILVTTDFETGNYVTKTKSKHTSRVRAVRLDSFVTQQKINRVDCIKIDVEGAELMVLRGAHKLLAQQHPLLILETQGQWTQRFGYEPVQVYEFLVSIGYRWRAAETHSEIKTKAQFIAALKRTNNFICEGTQ